MKTEKKTVTFDLLLLFLCLSVGLWLFFAAGPKEGGKYAAVYRNGTPYALLPLSEDTALTIEGCGGKSVLCIENGEAYIAEATCKDRLCMRSGRMKNSSDTSFCLPHRIEVRILGEGDVDFCE